MPGSAGKYWGGNSETVTAHFVSQSFPVAHCWGVIPFCLKLSWDSITVYSKQDEFQRKSHIHINSWIGTNKKEVLQWLNLDVSLGFLLPSAFPGCSQDLVLETSRQLWQSGGSPRIRKITFGKAAHLCVPVGTKQAWPLGFRLFFFFGYIWRHIDLAKLKRFPGASAHPKLVVAPANYYWGQWGYVTLLRIDFLGMKLYPVLINMLKSFPLAQRCACMCQVKYPE